MLYAIGEVVLVVIGILIALQINNWNSERILSSNIYESIEFQPIREKIRKYQSNYQRIKGLEKKLNESIEEREIEISKDGSILELYEYSNLVFSLSYNEKEIDDETDNKIVNYFSNFELIN